MTLTKMDNKEVIEETVNTKLPNIVDAVREGMKNVDSLENEIFTKIYGAKDYSLEEGIHMLKRVIGRLENARKQNAKDALETFLNNYCDSEKCSTCTFECIDKCLIKMQIGFLERGEE